jgi:hypothetical protein
MSCLIGGSTQDCQKLESGTFERPLLGENAITSGQLSLLLQG